MKIESDADKIQKIKSIVSSTNCEQANYCTIAEEIRKILEDKRNLPQENKKAEE